MEVKTGNRKNETNSLVEKQSNTNEISGFNSGQDCT